MTKLRYPRSYSLFLIGVCLLALMPASGLAQSTCPALVEQALTALGNNCAGLDRNSACYGYDHVDAVFNQQVASDFFTRPADRGLLTIFDTIRTAPLDLALEQWGIAVLNVQANVPNTLPGQAVTMLLMGDAAVENRVPPDKASLPAEPISVVTQVVAELFDAPDINATQIIAVASGTELPADAISPDRQWVRTSYEGTPAWVNIDELSLSDQILSLPEFSETSLTPMQAFYFQTGVGEPECSQAPSLVAVQSPEHLNIDLSVNGAQIQMGSLVTMQSTSPTHVVMVVHDGHLEVDGGIVVETGQAIDVELDEEGNIISWGQPRPATPDELLAGVTAREAINRLNSSPTPPAESGCGPGVTHTVQPGENLFRIALRYGTTMATIARANNLADPTVIYVGQQLAIPCGTETGIPGVQQQVSGVDCAPFRATSPLDGLHYGMNVFYWDPAPGATGYRVNVYNLDGNTTRLAASFETGPAATNLSADITNETVGQGFSFAWEVQALYNGQVACTSARATMQREARFEPTDRPPGPTTCPPAPPFCNFNYLCEPCLGESNPSCPSDC